MTLDEEKKEILAVLDRAGLPLRPIEIAEATGLALRRVNATLKRLEVLGQVRVVRMTRDCTVQDGAGYAVTVGTGYTLVGRVE